MNKILTDLTTVIPFTLIGITLIICMIIIIVLKRKSNKIITHPNKKTSSVASLNMIDNYCSEMEMKFLEALHKALPRDFIAFPYVGVDNIVNPKNDKNAYNKILSKYVDICIFYRRTMQPVLAIDLFNSNPIKQALKKMDKDVYDALKMINLSIIEIKLADDYDLNILRKNIYDSLPPKIFALIKNNK